MGNLNNEFSQKPMAHHLQTCKKLQVLNLLCEGSSMRSTSRIVECSINTVASLLKKVGSTSEQFQYRTLTKINCKKVQVDEIWAFCNKKQAKANKNKPKASAHTGDTWTWTAVDPDSKLVICWHTGTRELDSAARFMRDLRTRLAGRVQITSDGYIAYIQAVEAAFGSEVDYGMLVKNYANDNLILQKTAIIGNPRLADISTSMVERQNLSMRMGMRRFTRKTNAHSKKLEYHKYAIALYFMYFNFIKIHSGLRVTPAMEAGISDHPWTWEEVLALPADKY